MRYYHVRIGRKSDTAHDLTRVDLTEDELEERFLAPYREGRPIVIGGKTVPPDDLEQIKISYTDQPAQSYVAQIRAEDARSSVFVVGGPSDEWRIADRGTDVTDQLIREPPGHAVKAAVRGRKMSTVAAKSFVVHGHDKALLQEVARFIESLGVEAIILMEQPHKGRTLIEKLEHHADVPYAVILCTGDDVGREQNEPDLQPRPRQNVVLEFGFFIGALGRERVCVLKTPGIEMPSDLHGVGYHDIDAGGGWKLALAQEMKAAGLPVDLNRAVSR